MKALRIAGAARAASSMRKRATASRFRLITVAVR